MDIDHKNPSPLYRQIADNIRKEIVSGKLAVGTQIDPQKKLVEKYGVSLITVKRALGDLIGEGVLYSRVGKGTYVLRAPSKKNLLSKSIGLVLKNLKSPFFSMIVHSVEQFASEKGFDVLLSNTSQNLEKEESQIRHFYDKGVSGMVIASMSHVYTANATLRFIHESNYPYIMVSYIDDPDLYYVGTNHVDGAYQAASHLASLGFKRIGYINGELGNIVGELRLKGFKKALDEFKLPFKESDHFRLRLRGEIHDFSSGYEIGERFSTMKDRPEAMFVYNDLSALGFMQAVLERGLKVPNDVAIVGFDDIDRSSIAPVPLTTIRQSAQQIGAAAVENLAKRMNGEEVEVKTILKPQLIVRDSCGAKRKMKRPA
jgi:DNA-binding LacI/PurR family transcriptional regulator